MRHTVLLFANAAFALTIAAASLAGPVTADMTPALFKRLSALEGDWVGTSTKGWSDSSNFRTIAAGSVVVQTSFDAHPGETMMTMYHLDGSRVMLTHYCVAKNQPRLVATEASPDGKTFTFTFLDATGIPSREAGHMDKAVFTFEDDDNFTSRWTWYQNGSEQWMEEIRYRRQRRTTAP